MKRIIVLTMGFLLLCSCAAGNLQTMRSRCAGRVDPISVNDQQKYEQDFAECTQYAADWLTKAQGEAVARAFIGGLVGAAAGAAIGGSIGGNRGARYGAGIGATHGSIGGAASTPNYAEVVFGNCMLNRDYQLLW